MPELPEVETVCRGLAPHITGKTIARVTINRSDLRIPLPDNLKQSLEGHVITHVSRRAKYVLIHLDTAEILIIHLGMSGSLVLHDRPPENFRKHDHVIIELSPYKLMVFHDPRRFGLITLATHTALNDHPLFANLGPEPFDCDHAYFYETLHKAKAPVKSVIMDQRKIVGVGNIYACEALFRSHIHPARLANTLTKKEAKLLLTHIQQTLKDAIESGGSTLRDYVRSSGDAGYFQHEFRVYGRNKEACTACESPISLMRQAGRSTFSAAIAKNNGHIYTFLT